jgi:hypothetical protein
MFWLDSSTCSTKLSSCGVGEVLPPGVPGSWHSAVVVAAVVADYVGGGQLPAVGLAELGGDRCVRAAVVGADGAAR